MRFLTDYINTEKKSVVKRWIFRLSTVAAVLLAAVSARAGQRYKIGVVHSYEKSYHDAAR